MVSKDFFCERHSKQAIAEKMLPLTEGKLESDFMHMKHLHDYIHIQF